MLGLILLIVLKLAALTSLIERQQATPYLIIAPTLGRWSTVLLNVLLPYARRTELEGAIPTGSVTDNVSWRELAIATFTAVLIVFPLARWYGALSWISVLAISGIMARICWVRIGGVTGDTLGANAELCEAAVLLIPLAIGH